VLYAQGDLKGAKEMHEKALKIKIKAFGTEEHTSVATSYMNLGDVCLSLKQVDQARNHYFKAKQIYQKTVGDTYSAFFDGKIKECNDLGNNSTVSSRNREGVHQTDELVGHSSTPPQANARSEPSNTGNRGKKCLIS
jgi:tetratricopeptide (TPR) repeat protein